MNLRTILSILIMTTVAHPAFATNALRGKSFSPQASSPQREELKVNKEFTSGRQPLITYADVAAVVPTNFEDANHETIDTEDLGPKSYNPEIAIQEAAHLENQVRDRMLQNSANLMMKSSFIKDSFIFRTAKQVEESTKVDVNIKSNTDSVTEKPIEHRFNFDIQALKQEARVMYQGYVDSQIEYRAQDATLKISFEEKLSSQSKIALTHIKDRFQSRQLLQYSLNW